MGTLRKGQSIRTIRTSEVPSGLKDLQVKVVAKSISHELQVENNENRGKYEINKHCILIIKREGENRSISSKTYLGRRIGRKRMSCSSKNKGSQDYLET